MDQKDNGATARKLASASELRGNKSGKAGNGKGGRKMWVSLISLVVVLGLAVGAVFLSDMIKPEEEIVPEATAKPSTTVKIVDREKKDVASVTVQPAGKAAYTVISNAEASGTGEDVKYTYTYEIEGQPEFQLDQSLAGSIIGYAANMTATDLITENETEFAAYGLEEPALTVTMNYRDGTKAVWQFGNKVTGGSGYYVREEGKSAIFVLYSSAFTALNMELNDLYVVSMPVTFEDYSLIQHLLVEQKGKDTIELSYRSAEEESFSISTLELVQPIRYDAHGDRAAEIFEACAALTITGYAGEKSELTEAGLDDPRAKIYASDADGNQLVFIVGNHKDTSNVYVQIDETEAVYLADASLLTFLDNVKVAYLVDQFANLVNIQKVDALTVTAGSESYEMSIKREPALDENGNQETNSNGQPKTNDTYFFDGEETDETPFKKLYQVIIGTQVSKIHDDHEYVGECAVRVAYKLNIAPYDFVIEYYEYDDQYYAVRRNDLTLFLIKKDRIDNLVAQMEAYRNGTFVAE